METHAEGPAAQRGQPTIETLRRELEALGLSGSEARVLIALLTHGSGTATELGRIARVPRPRMYHVLESLSGRRLAEQLPGRVATWASPGRDVVIDRLQEERAERLRELQARTEGVRTIMASLIPVESAPPLPYVHMIRDPRQAETEFERLQAEARRETLVFSRPPYALEQRLNTAELSALARGVSCRGLYQAAELEDPDAEAYRRNLAVYLDAGELARVVDDLPLKLAVFDRQCGLLSLEDPGLPTGYPTVLLVEHPGFAAFAAAAFEQYWSEGRQIGTGMLVRRDANGDR